MNYSITFKKDDFTPFYFVVDLLIFFFKLNEKDSIEKVNVLEKTGELNICMFNYEITEAKLIEIRDFIKYHKLDLKVYMKKDEKVC